MGEYVLYYGGKVVGGIYDNRLLVKPTPSAVVLMPEAPRELPYEGAKEMLLVEDIDNRGFLNKLFEMMYEELPEPKRKSNQIPICRGVKIEQHLPRFCCRGYFFDYRDAIIER